jgi:hypothetical protein
MKNLSAILLILSCFTTVYAAPVIERASEISLYPTWLQNPEYLKRIGAHEAQSNYYLFANTRVNLTQGNVTFEIQPELRAVQTTAEAGPTTTQLTPEMRAAVRPPERLMDLHTQLSSRGEREAVLDVERLNFSYRVNAAQLSVGRRPVSLGVLSVFPVWNKFTRPLVTDYGPLRVFSQDQASLRVQRGEWLMQALDIEGPDGKNSDATRVLEVTWFGDGVELHVIGGSWWQSGAVGIAAVKDLWGTSIRVEEISFSADGVQAGVGAERAFNDKWSGLIEFMYLESGADDKKDYLTLPASRFRPLTARDYGFARLEYKPAPLWILQFGSLVNLVDGSPLWDAKVLYSAANDLEISGEFRLPSGDGTSELSRQVLPTQALLGVRYDF